MGIIHETFIVMEPDGAVGAPMTIISGTSAANPSYPIVTNEHTGIGLGILVPFNC
jgi:hypothetical protein